MTTPNPPKNGPSPDIRAAAMNTYRATRAGINPGVLKAMKEFISEAKITYPSFPPPEGEGRVGVAGSAVCPPNIVNPPPNPLPAGRGDENVSRQKTYETVLKFMTLSKGSKEFMKQIAESLSKR